MAFMLTGRELSEYLCWLGSYIDETVSHDGDKDFVVFLSKSKLIC